MGKEKRPDAETARRALEEADARRQKQRATEQKLAGKTEFNGSKGPDPTRYGDWENKGIVSDF